LTEPELGCSHPDGIPILQAGGLLNPAVVDEGSIAAAEIHNPKTLLSAIVNQRVPTRGALIIERKLITRATADGKAIGNPDACAIFWFQPSFHDSSQTAAGERSLRRPHACQSSSRKS
jgi:hypothetical protein